MFSLAAHYDFDTSERRANSAEDFALLNRILFNDSGIML
jgi:hypothetical protein